MVNILQISMSVRSAHRSVWQMLTAPTPTARMCANVKMATTEPPMKEDIVQVRCFKKNMIYLFQEVSKLCSTSWSTKEDF